MLVGQPSLSRLSPSMEHPVWEFHVELGCRNAKSPASAEAGLAIDDLSIALVLRTRALSFD
jgi:hypothetical protein